jgi:hypothetical protein
MVQSSPSPVQPKDEEDCTTPSDTYSDFDDYLSSPDEQQPNESSQSSSCRYLTRFNGKKTILPERVVSKKISLS